MEEFSDQVQRILDNLDNVVTLAKSESAQKIKSEMLYRVFSKGEARDNSQIGKYNEHFSLEHEGKTQNYIKLRQSKGLQTAHVDLVFTSSLNQSITSLENKVFFMNTYGQTVSKANEKNFGKVIFRASDEEKQIYFDTLNDELNKLYHNGQ